MVTAKNVSVLMATCAVAVLASCVMAPRAGLATSADRLEHDAHALSVNAHEDPYAGYPTTYSRDAHVLAEDAYEFRRAVEGRPTSDPDVRAAFTRVSRSYHVVRDEVERTDSRQAHVDLQPVTESYLDLERAMGGYPDRETRLSDERR